MIELPKLQKIVNDENDITLHDWQRVLNGEPVMFHTIPPNWLCRLPEQEHDALLWVIDLRLRPTDFTKLGGMIDRETDITLYNWFSRLQGKPMMPNAKLPKWLGWYLGIRSTNDVFRNGGRRSIGVLSYFTPRFLSSHGADHAEKTSASL